MTNGKPMDQLTRDAIAADAAGISYGKYMALHRQVKPVAVRFPKRAKEQAKAQQQDTDQPPRPLCRCCGNPIPETVKSHTYCSAVCADEARRQQKLAAYQRIREQEVVVEEKPKLLCIRCGKEIPQYATRRKYCSAACADEAIEEQRRQARQRARLARRR